MDVSQPQQDPKKSWLTVAWIAAAPVVYAVVFLLRSYPLVLNWDKHLFGRAAVDQSTQLWLYWWTKFALWESPQSLLYTHHLNHPLGVDITGDFICFLHALLSVPLQWIFGLVGAVNSLYLFSYVMSSFGTFLLVRYLTRSNLAAFFMGLLIAHTPYFTSLNYLNTDVLNVGFMALFLLYLVRTTREVGWRAPVLAGVMLGLASLENMEHGLFMYLFFGFHLAHTCLAHRGRLDQLKPIIKRMGVLVVVFAVLVTPFTAVIISHLQEHHPRTPDWLGKGELAVARDCEPGQMEPTKYKTRSQGKISAGKLAVLVLGMGLIIASLLLLGAGRQLWYWFAAALLFLLASAGDQVSILMGGDNPMAPPALALDSHLYMLAHDHLPFVWRFGWPDRLVMVTILCLLVLAALGLTRLRRAIQQWGRARAAAAAAVLVVSTLTTISIVHWEQWRLPGPDAHSFRVWMPLRLPSTPYHPEPMYRDLGAEAGDFAVMVLPALDWTGPVAMGNMRYAQQPVMKKRLADCHIPPFKVRYQISCAYLDFNKYTHLGLMDPGPLPARPTQIINDLIKIKIKYVVVNLMIPAPYERSRLLGMLDSWLRRHRTYQHRYVVYKLY